MRKIAVVGCGAIGCYYGAKLGAAGLETHFLLRSDYEVVRRQGVEIRTSREVIRHQPVCAQTAAEIGESDLVLIALKTTANDQFERLLKPLVGPATAILTLQNGLGNEESLADLFGAEKVLGGLCFICANRVAPGVVQHVAHGAIMLAEYGRASQARAHEIASMMRKADIECQVTDSLPRSHWEKLVWNVPFNGLGVAGAVGYEAALSGVLPAGGQTGPCLSCDRLLDRGPWEELARELMAEVIAAANAQGLPLPADTAERQISRTRYMGPYKASTLLDFEKGQSLEVDSLFAEPLRRAGQAGVATPRLAALCRLMRALDEKLRRTQ